jgi:hypothetical protein
MQDARDQGAARAELERMVDGQRSRLLDLEQQGEAREREMARLDRRVQFACDLLDDWFQRGDGQQTKNASGPTGPDPVRWKVSRWLRPAARFEAEKEIVWSSGFFDPRWYIEKYMKGPAKRADALEHFFDQGWRKGYDPGPDFDTTWYLEQYPELRERGENAIVHFLTEGFATGATASPQFDTLRYFEILRGEAAKQRNKESRPKDAPVSARRRRARQQ